MCGIAGICGRAPAPGVLDAMAGAMVHRGPDSQGTWAWDAGGLAFRRLAIIDLEERSNQPLHLGPLHMTFNGEVYDYVERRAELEALGHRFETAGDGEVLLHAWQEWGEGALDRVNAMFAVAVYDERDRSLTLATDPFGEKPLFWYRDSEALAFGSDVRAILAAAPGGARPDEEALATYLATGLPPAPGGSFFAGVHRLPGAHVLRFAGGEVQLRRYWMPQERAVPARYDDAVAELRDLLTDAVRLRLRADVPVGTSLSGGVDSSAIVGLVGRLEPDADRHAFTARFPGFERDEWRYAQATAAQAGVGHHHGVQPTAAELLDDLDALVVDQEEPFATLSIYAQWRVMRCAYDAGVKVLLDGQGADELFAGYDATARLAARAAGDREHGLGAGGLREAVLTRAPAPVHRWARRRASSPYAGRDGAARGPAGAEWLRGESPLRGALQREAFATVLPSLLRYADRDSMAHSREARLPFLDRRIAEWALSAPPGHLNRDGASKAVLRDAVRDLVPDVVLARREKVGFEPPQAAWMREPAFRDRVADALLDPGARLGDRLDRTAVAADVQAGAWRDQAGLWRALNAELWLRAFT